MKSILKLETHGISGYLGLGYMGIDDTPRIGWFDLDGSFVHIAGSGYLDRELDLEYGTLNAWLENLTLYLKENDCLRARGDVRYRVASRAHGMILEACSKV